VLRKFTRAWHAARFVWKSSVFTAHSESRLSSKVFQARNTILHFDRVQGRSSYACCIDQHIYMCITPARRIHRNTRSQESVDILYNINFLQAAKDVTPRIKLSKNKFPQPIM
jgi:hypothetical protein